MNKFWWRTKECGKLEVWGVRKLKNILILLPT